MEDKQYKNKSKQMKWYQKKTYAVLGLGVFGSTVAKTLEKYGCEVLAVDQNLMTIEGISKKVTKASALDITDKEELLALKIGKMDVVIIAVPNHLESAVLATMHLKELGNPYVIAKAKNPQHQRILEKVGVDEVVYIEKEMGENLARRLLHKSIVDMRALDDRYAVSSIKAPSFWHHKTVAQLNVGHVYKMKLIGMKQSGSDELSLNIDPEYQIGEGDTFLVIAQIEDLEKFDYLY